jgi:Tol biopolymer transport system component
MSPTLSPDGARLAFARVERNGPAKLWMAAVSGGAPVRLTSPDDTEGLAGTWSPDGAWFAYWHTAARTLSLARVRTTGQTAPEILVRNVEPENSVPVWSPTGEWILYDNNGWRLRSPETTAERDLALKADVCTFSRDATQLYCVRRAGQGSVLFSRLLAGGSERAITRLASHQAPNSLLQPSLKMTLTPDGQHVTFSARQTESNLWLLSGIDSRPARQVP